MSLVFRTKALFMWKWLEDIFEMFFSNKFSDESLINYLCPLILLQWMLQTAYFCLLSKSCNFASKLHVFLHHELCRNKFARKQAFLKTSNWWTWQVIAMNCVSPILWYLQSHQRFCYASPPWTCFSLDVSKETVPWKHKHVENYL